MHKDLFTREYQRIITESKEDFLNQYYRFKNMITKLKWDDEDSKVLDAYTDKLKEINDSLYFKDGNQEEEQYTKNNHLVQLKNAIKYDIPCNNENIERFLNQNICGNKIEPVVKKPLNKRPIKKKIIEEKIITRKQVLRDICNRANIWNNLKLLNELYKFIIECTEFLGDNRSIEEKCNWNKDGNTSLLIPIPTSGIEKIIYDYKPYIGLISNNDSQVGPGEIWLTFKFNLQLSPQRDIDLETCQVGGNRTLYEVKGNNAGIHLDFAQPDPLFKSSCLCESLGVTNIDRASHIVKEGTNLTIICASQIENAFVGKFRKQEFTDEEWVALGRSGDTQIKVALVADSIYKECFGPTGINEKDEAGNINPLFEEANEKFMKKVVKAKNNAMIEKPTQPIQFLEYKDRSKGSVAVDKKFFKLIR